MLIHLILVAKINNNFIMAYVFFIFIQPPKSKRQKTNKTNLFQKGSKQTSRHIVDKPNIK
jgi:hypothetical protein